MHALRTVLAAVLGALLFALVALDLVLFGVLELSSPLVTVLTFAGLALGIVLGRVARPRPDGRRR